VRTVHSIMCFFPVGRSLRRHHVARNDCQKLLRALPHRSLSPEPVLQLPQRQPKTHARPRLSPWRSILPRHCRARTIAMNAQNESRPHLLRCVTFYNLPLAEIGVAFPALALKPRRVNHHSSRSSTSSNAFASFRSRVSNPSVNHCAAIACFGGGAEAP
jgi:hypothetical protein